VLLTSAVDEVGDLATTVNGLAREDDELAAVQQYLPRRRSGSRRRIPMTRPNYFNNVHKAVRAALFETSLRVARTDFGELEEASATARNVIELMDFLDEHAGHEQRFVFPELASFAPLLAAELEADHARMDELQTEIRRFAHAVHGPSKEDREEKGRRLARARERNSACSAVFSAAITRLTSRAWWSGGMEAPIRAWISASSASVRCAQAAALASVSSRSRWRS